MPRTLSASNSKHTCMTLTLHNEPSRIFMFFFCCVQLKIVQRVVAIYLKRTKSKTNQHLPLSFCLTCTYNAQPQRWQAPHRPSSSVPHITCMACKPTHLFLHRLHVRRWKLKKKLYTCVPLILVEPPINPQRKLRNYWVGWFVCGSPGCDSTHTHTETRAV